MEKRLAIIGNTKAAVEMYARQIDSVFHGALATQIYNIQSGLPAGGIDADIVLIESNNILGYTVGRIRDDAEIIFARRTLSKRGLNLISEIPEGKDAVLVDENTEMAEDLVSALCQIGVHHIRLRPGTRRSINASRDAIQLLLSDPAPENAADSMLPSIRSLTEKRLVDDEASTFGQMLIIGPCLLDVSTIIDVGVRANLDHILNNQNIRKSYQEIVTLNIGFAAILTKTNRFESSLDIVLGAFDQGVIAVDSNGDVFACNEKARIIMDCEDASVIGANCREAFPGINFGSVLGSEAPIAETLKQIRGYDVIVTVKPVIHSEKKLGAVAIVKRYSDEERKQHAIRSQIIGKGHVAKYKFDDILGGSPAIVKCKASALNMARSDSSVLITGESGTGKEMFAQAIHNSSKRKAFQFVAVNCGALPENLLESELFGYEEGAFTGARKGGKPGLFELAHRGTLFLDEIGEMPFNLQRSLLRALQEREVMRIGGDRMINVDIRLIAATNRDLREMVKEGKFRSDLYYRLNVLPLFIPPLRSRREDIPTLIEDFKETFAWDFELSHTAREAVLYHAWNGNIRELRNCVEYITNMKIRRVDMQDLMLDLEEPAATAASAVNDSGAAIGRGNPAAADESRVSEELMKCCNDLKSRSGKGIAKYVFVLQELENAFIQLKRAGRRSLFSKAREQGVFVSEQEIRTLLVDLEKLNLVAISTGRGGTVITDRGRTALKYLMGE